MKILESNLLVNNKEISYCKAERSYTEVVYQNGSRKLVCQNIKQIENLISELNLFRCHYSFIVNISSIIKVDLKNLRLELDNGVIIPISRRRIKNLPDLRKIMKTKN